MLFAHPEHGFHHAPEGEAETLKASGWEPCADPMEYKARVWGIGKPKAPAVEAPAEVPEAPADEAESEPEIESVRRRGRPRKAE